MDLIKLVRGIAAMRLRVPLKPPEMPAFGLVEQHRAAPARSHRRQLMRLYGRRQALKVIKEQRAALKAE